MTPPLPIPSNSAYTSCYCEENVYLICQEFLQNESNSWDIFVVFVSNGNKTVALWCQKAARLEDAPVIWDYHVILVLRPRNKATEMGLSWVYDFDTRLSMPCQWKRYLRMTFPEAISPIYESQFRVIPGDLFLHHFASDRTHMLVRVQIDKETDAEHEGSPADVLYSSPPPPYAAICGPLALQEGITNNLMSSYVSMKAGDTNFYGVVVDRTEVDAFFTV